MQILKEITIAIALLSFLTALIYWALDLKHYKD
jgi:hypothetical protein